MRRPQLRCIAVLLVVMSGIAACSDDPEDNPVGPVGSGSGTDPAITNNTDDFQFQLNTTNFSTNGGYTWRNTGTTARVTQSSSISSGAGTLLVRDSGGRVVYSRNLSEGGTVTTEAGPTGDWRIEVAPVGVTGSINFRVQKN